MKNISRNVANQLISVSLFISNIIATGVASYVDSIASYSIHSCQPWQWFVGIHNLFIDQHIHTHTHARTHAHTHTHTHTHVHIHKALANYPMQPLYN